MRPGGRQVIAAAVVCACSVWAGGAAASETIPNRHQVTALFVLDHRGHNPRGDVDIRPYSRAFNKIVTHCTIGCDARTNRTFWLAEKGRVRGGRRVSSLMMLQSIARRLTWVTPKRSCAHIFDPAEAHLEAGAP